MRIIISKDGKKISKKKAEQLLGKKDLETRIKNSIQYVIEECGCENTSTYMDGFMITVLGLTF